MSKCEIFDTFSTTIWNDKCTNKTFIFSDGIGTQCQQRRQLERQRDGGWIQTHRDLHQGEWGWRPHCSDPRQVRLNIQSHFFSGMATCGPTGAQQALVVRAKKKLRWRNIKTSSPSPATAMTGQAPSAPFKQRAQQAGVGDRMDSTDPLMAEQAFDLRLMHRAMVWDPTTSLGIRLGANASSGGCINTIKWKPERLILIGHCINHQSNQEKTVIIVYIVNLLSNANHN